MMKAIFWVGLTILTMNSQQVFSKDLSLKCQVNLLGEKAVELHGQSKVPKETLIEFGDFYLVGAVKDMKLKDAEEFQKFLTIDIRKTVNQLSKPGYGDNLRHHWNTEVQVKVSKGRPLAFLGGYEFIDGAYDGKKFTRADYECEVR